MTTLEQFSALVADIYDAALDPSLWEQTLQRVFSAAGGNAGTLFVFDRRRGRWQHFTNGNLDPEEGRKYDEYYGRIDPLPSFMERTRAGAIVTARAVMTERQRRGEFFSDWAKPNEVGDAIFVNLLGGPDGVCVLAMGHPWRSEPFATPEVLRLVGLLAPHFQRAMQAQMGFGPLNLVRDGALDLVEHWRHGCVIISALGHVLYANRVASEIAGARDGLSLGSRGLRAASDDAALQHLIHQACTGDRHGPRSSSRIAVSRDSGRKPYSVQVMPLRSRNAVFSTAAALVLIVDSERTAPPSPEDLQKLYDLTPAEAEVAIRVLKGRGLQSVADELCVTRSTVRVHQQRVFEKTGTHRQAELVRLLLDLEPINMPGSLEGAA